MKERIDIYINGERLPVRLNGYARHLLAKQDAITEPAIAALCAFLQVSEESALPAAIAAFCEQHECTRNWLVEYAICRHLDRQT